MTQFFVKDTRLGEHIFHRTTRELYKKIITVTDQLGAKYRVATLYVSGMPVKQLTLFPPGPGEHDYEISYHDHS